VPVCTVTAALLAMAEESVDVPVPAVFSRVPALVNVPPPDWLTPPLSVRSNVAPPALLSVAPFSSNRVFVPASLIANWKAELDRFAPTLTYAIAHPSELPAGKDELSAADEVVHEVRMGSHP